MTTHLTSPADWRTSARYTGIIPVAVLVVLGEDGRPTLVRQKGGPFAGRWMLPGGVIELGEAAKAAAVRECAEETGIEVPVSCVTGIGTYEIIADWPGTPRYHVLLSAHLAEGSYRLPAGFVGDNGGGVVQAGPDHVRLHSTDRRILSDAGVVRTPARVLEDDLDSDQLTISVLS
ncbi:NUDIX domain-containing protein [Lentzea chajnantorensis]